MIFRMTSKHAFHQESRTSAEAEACIAKFVGIESGNLPATRTIDDVFNKLNHEDLNEVLMSTFETMRKDKFFADHSELTPQGAYHLALDAEVVHKYTPESAHDCEQCPFCLKRQRGEKIWYVHMHVIVCIVCPGGIRIPLYLYPVHAKSLKSKETASDDTFKQECELAAFPVIVKKIRERFPRLHFCVLLDSLYANGPAMEVLEENGMDFMIVRKEGSMKTVGEDCDGLEKLAEDKTHGQLEESCIEGGKRIKRSYRFFNDVDYKKMKLHILRFEQWTFDKDGAQIDYVYWEWIASWRLTKKNAPQSAQRGRLRWRRCVQYI